MRLRPVALVALAALSGCKIELTKPGAQTSDASVVAAPRPAPPPASSPAAVARCGPVIDHWVDLLKRDKKVDVPAKDKTESIEQCEKESWSPAMVDCIGGASKVAEIEDRCYKLAFSESRVSITPKRTFSVDEIAAGKKPDPPMFTQDGDTATFTDNGKKCAVIAAMKGPGTGAFIVCNGDTLAGPLTTESEMKQAVTIVNNARRAEAARNAPAGGGNHGGANGYDLARSVRASWPNGGGGYEVYNAKTGQPLYKTY